MSESEKEKFIREIDQILEIITDEDCEQRNLKTIISQMGALSKPLQQIIFN